MATTYFKQLTLHYDEKEWHFLSTVMLSKWAECLEALGNIRESLVVSLRALQSMAFQPHLRSTMTNALRNVCDASRSLDHGLSASLDHCFRDCVLDTHIHHFVDQDGFWVTLRFESPFGIDIEAGNLQVELQGLREERSNILRLSNEASATAISGHNELQLSTKVPSSLSVGAKQANRFQDVTSGWYALRKIQLKVGKIVFAQDTSEGADVLALPDARNAPDATNSIEHFAKSLLIWPHVRNLSVEVGPTQYIDLSKPRMLAIQISAGWNDILRGSINVKPATPGLRVYNSEASVSTPVPTTPSESLRSAEIAFGNVHSDDRVNIEVPYSLETEYPEIFVRTTVRYITPEGDFQISLQHVVPHTLSLAVNVQDNFKKTSLLSRFIVGSAIAAPVRIVEYTMTDNELYGASILGSADLHSPSFTCQTLDILAEIHGKQRRNLDQRSGIPSKRLALSLSYQSFTHEIAQQAERCLIDSISTPLRSQYSIVLSMHLKANLLKNMTPQHLEKSGMHKKLRLQTYNELSWDDLLQAFPAREASVLKKDLENFHEVSGLGTESIENH